jgi:hypothetical protein
MILDGTVHTSIETVRFGLDGVNYEIDLRDANIGALRDQLAEFIDVARRTGGRMKRPLQWLKSSGGFRS